MDLRTFFFLTFQIGSVCDEEFKKIFFDKVGMVFICGGGVEYIEDDERVRSIYNSSHHAYI